ncbi:MAG: hypothetical protein ABSB82_22495 [Terriglobia bacterium]
MAKKDVEKYRKELFEGDPEKPLTKSEGADIGKSLAAAQRPEALDLEQERQKFTTEAAARRATKPNSRPSRRSTTSEICCSSRPRK